MPAEQALPLVAALTVVGQLDGVAAHLLRHALHAGSLGPQQLVLRRDARPRADSTSSWAVGKQRREGRPASSAPTGSSCCRAGCCCCVPGPPPHLGAALVQSLRHHGRLHGLPARQVEGRGGGVVPAGTRAGGGVGGAPAVGGAARGARRRCGPALAWLQAPHGPPQQRQRAPCRHPLAAPHSWEALHHWPSSSTRHERSQPRQPPKPAHS